MDFIRILFVILFALEKFHVFKTAFLGQQNVHLVLIILIRREKFVLAFLDFYLFFCDFFGFGKYLKKKAERRLGRSPAARPSPPASRLPPGDRRRRVPIRDETRRTR